MRAALIPFLDRKHPFSASVERFSLRRVPYRGAEPTMLLRELCLHTDAAIAPIDHIWTHVGKIIAGFNPSRGDRIAFNAWVREYRKYNSDLGEYRLDYCISHLSNLELISAGEGQSFADYWTKLSRSGKFITDRISVPCTGSIPERRDELCTA